MVEDPLEVLFSCWGVECVSLFRVDYEELEVVLGHGLVWLGWWRMYCFVKGGSEKNLTELIAGILCRDGI